MPELPLQRRQVVKHLARAGNPLLIGVDNDRWAINAVEAAHIHVALIEKPKRSLLAILLGS